MVNQNFIIGQKVLSNKYKFPWKRSPYRVVKVEPVFEKVSLLQKILPFFKSKIQGTQILSYRYHCKSTIELRTFLQKDLIRYIDS
jgi:hypothetical protein